MSKTRKQVRVRTKKGKTYTRSMLVNSGSAAAISRRATQVSLKQDSAKPNKPGLISRLFFRGGKNQSRSALAAMNHDGPNAGSDHSWLALLVGARRQTDAVDQERLRGEMTQRYGAIEARNGSAMHASDRRTAGALAVPRMLYPGRASAQFDYDGRVRGVASEYMDGSAERVPQDPNKWVR